MSAQIRVSPGRDYDSLTSITAFDGGEFEASGTSTTIGGRVGYFVFF